MPMPYTMPTIPNRYPLDKNDKLGLLIGTLLSGGLAAAGSRNTGESPLLRGVAGATSGFGAGGKAINDSYSAMLDDYLKNEKMDFSNRQFGQQVREYEESEKPSQEAQARWYDAMSRNTDFDNQMAFDKMIQERLNGKKNERFNTRMNQMNMALKKNEVVNSRPRPITEKIKPAKMPDVGNYGKLQAQLAALKSNQNMDYLGMPADERAKRISALENSIRLMEQYQPELIAPQQQTQQIPQQNDVIARHQNDSGMQGTELGKLTPQGYEVYKNGKLVGHYQ